MTLQAQIYSLVERISEKFSGVDARIGAHAALAAITIELSQY